MILLSISPSFYSVAEAASISMDAASIKAHAVPAVRPFRSI